MNDAWRCAEMGSKDLQFIAHFPAFELVTVANAFASLSIELDSQTFMTKLAVTIVEEYIEVTAPFELSTKSEAKKVECLEALLWRSYDALKSISILLPAGLPADCEVLLRVLIEANSLFGYFAQSGVSKIDGYRRYCLLKEAVDLEWFIDRNDDAGFTEDGPIREKYQQVLAELRQLGTERTTGSDGTRQWSGNKAKKNYHWQDLVRDEELRHMYNGETWRAYFDAVFAGNVCAHSNVQCWPHWVIREDRKVSSIGKVIPVAPARLPIISMIVISKYIRSLRRLRPEVTPQYERLFELAYIVGAHRVQREAGYRK